MYEDIKKDIEGGDIGFMNEECGIGGDDGGYDGFKGFNRRRDI
ncbi:hypothetical protein [Staphylococcus warneri]|nr:hypothetical protein [Staphylococcus warneri]